MAFFNTISEIKKIISINTSFKFDELLPYLKEVDSSVLKKYLGAEFLADLQQAFDDNSVNEDFIEIFELLKYISAPFAMIKWIPSGQLHISDSGISVVSTENLKTPFQWQIRDLRRALIQLAYTKLEDLLEYLDKNLDEPNFSSYKDSEEYKENKEFFISSGKEFSRFYTRMKNCRVLFYELKSIMRKVEDFDIKGILLPDLYNDLKEKIKSGDGELEGADLAIIKLINPAIANLTISRSINEMSAELSEDGYLVFDNTGNNGTINNKKQAEQNTLTRIMDAAEKDGRIYLDKLAKFLEANKGDYDLYTADALYKDPTSYVPVNQNTDQSFFSAI